MTCAIPAAITGGTLITTDSPNYANGDRAVFTCNSGYVMSGVPYATCQTGVWTTFPTCILRTSNNVDVTVNDKDDDDDVATILLYVAIAACCILVLLLVTCALVCCCQLFGGYGEGMLFGQPKRCWCCESRRSNQRSCTTFPRRYELDDDGRRFHLDDNCHRCYYNHKMQKVTSHTISPDPTYHTQVHM